MALFQREKNVDTQSLSMLSSFKKKLEHKLHIIFFLRLFFKICKVSVAKWRPTTFTSHSSSFYTVTAEGNVQTTYNNVHKLKQIYFEGQVRI